MALASGNLAEAGKQVQDAHSLFGTHDSQPQLLIHPSEVEMRLAAHEGRIDHARAIFRRVAAVGLSAGTERYTLPLLYSAVSIEADVHQARGANAEGRGLLAEVRAHAANLSAAAPIWHAHHLMLQAELNRAVGADTAEAWARAASALANLERPYELAIVHGRWAAALLARSGGASGARLIRQAHAAARSLGARLLTAELAATAARHGADLGPDGLQTPADDPASSALGASALRGMGLTPRECQVLRLLAVGRSNRQIGADLHISPKTASLHVSSILTKMNVATRTQAAAQVYRQGLFTDL
jgi:DNA-binding NarL/FixJ family response regulator